MNRPSTPFQHQPWPISRSTSPVPIPSPRLHPLSHHSVSSEWQKLRSHANQFHANQFHASRPYYQFRSRTPPSLSPSPAPSATTSYYESDLEIEELSDSPSDDSGIELLIGEYEEAPEGYVKTVYGSDNADTKETRHVLFGLQHLSATQAMCIPFKRQGAVSQRKKRAYDESSEEESGGSYDSGVGSVGSFESEWGRRVRRCVRRRVLDDDDDAVSVRSCGEESNCSSDNEIDMEL